MIRRRRPAPASKLLCQHAVFRWLDGLLLALPHQFETLVIQPTLEDAFLHARTRSQGPSPSSSRAAAASSRTRASESLRAARSAGRAAAARSFICRSPNAAARRRVALRTGAGKWQRIGEGIFCQRTHAKLFHRESFRPSAAARTGAASCPTKAKDISYRSESLAFSSSHHEILRPSNWGSRRSGQRPATAPATNRMPTPRRHAGFLSQSLTGSWETVFQGCPRRRSRVVFCGSDQRHVSQTMPKLRQRPVGLRGM